MVSGFLWTLLTRSVSGAADTGGAVTLHAFREQVTNWAEDLVSVNRQQIGLEEVISK